MRSLGVVRSGIMLGTMTCTLYAGPLDGLNVEVPEALPKYLEVDTGRGEVRRTHIYARRGDKYVYLRTRRVRSPLT
jgi:hypothetical protein